MFDAIVELISNQFVISATTAAMIGGAILKKTGALKWIRSKADIIGKALGKLGYNIGVLITTKGNNLPFVGVFYEYAIEPVIAVICEVIPGIVFKLFSEFTEGLKSDNTEFKGRLHD